MSNEIFEESRDCETSTEYAKNTNSLFNRASVLLARIEEDDDILEEYEDMISECIDNLEQAISDLKVEFNYPLNERDWDFSDKELENAIYKLVKAKKELEENN